MGEIDEDEEDEEDCSSIRFFMVEFQWFLMALSERPGRNFAISAQRFPMRECRSRRILSSSSLHAVFFMSGFKWLCQRSRHCLPKRPRRCLAISDQRFGPNFCTSSITLASSSFVHGPFMVGFYVAV